METVSPFDIEHITQHIFKLPELKTYQKDIIQDVLNQKDLLIVSPTGSGKSLCYQIPALKLQGTLIVISPLIALMIDQVEKLKHHGIPAQCLHSNMERDIQEAIYAQLLENKLKILYVSPERFLQQFFIHQLKKIKISAIAIDEAHCILHWGSDFRPEYERLSLVKKYFPDTPILALTATATPKQQDAIIQKLNLNATKHIFSAFKPNIYFKIIPQHTEKKSLTSILSKHPNETGIIYCASQKRVNYIYQHLKTLHTNVLCYHAGMSSEERAYQQQKFFEYPHPIMIATMAFGMGIDKKNIRFIIHYDVPGRLDQFIQESGRAGRDELPATSYIFYHPSQFFQFNLWRISKAPTLLQNELIDDLKIMSSFLIGKTCFQQLIFNYFEQLKISACEDCEACLNHDNKHDEITDKLKLLSCIYHLNYNACWDMIPDILIAYPSNKTKAWTSLSTYGIGANKPKGYWFHLLNELFAQDLIQLDVSSYPIWILTRDGKQFIKTHKN